MRSLISILDLSVSELDDLIATAKDIIVRPQAYRESCRYKKLATLFFEPSTRTRLSFEAAMLELGGSVLGFSEASSSSAAKGESMADTARILSCYADIMAIRHPRDGAPYVASRNASIPVINAGDGQHNHPTQTLADLLTISREIGRLNNMTIGLCGDLKYGRHAAGPGEVHRTRRRAGRALRHKGHSADPGRRTALRYGRDQDLIPKLQASR